MTIKATAVKRPPENNLSLIQKVLQRNTPEELLKKLTEEQQQALKFVWDAWKREEQFPDPNYFIWMYLAGRGSGKTRSGAEWAYERRKEGYARGAFVARTAADVRDTLVEGEAGIMEVSPPWDKPVYEPSKRRVYWGEKKKSYPGGVLKTVKASCRITTFSGEEPDALRGPSHDFAWADELASWKYMSDAWAMLMMGLRLRSPTGLEPKACVTTTPRSLPLIKELIEDPAVYITTGTTYDNKANLAPAFYDLMIKRYEGTRIGRQELLAEILDDNPNALFTRSDLDKARIRNKNEVPELMRIHVGVDPAVTSGEESSDTGIVVAGQCENDHYYILSDYTCHKKPMGWARQVLKAYCWDEADMVVGEVNNGGDLIEAVIRQVPKDEDSGIDIAGADVPYMTVRATRGKAVRAEPVGALCEQGRLHIVGVLPELEDQLVQYDPESTEISPDRYDAMVWAVISIMKEPVPRVGVI